MSQRPIDSSRLVFVGGLHRSGKTLLGENLAGHPDVSVMSGTGMPSDEGQHVQTVYPAAHRHGGPGRFARSRAAHLTEESGLATPENAARLLAAWEPYWDFDRRLLVETSPPNLLMMRFLQALYPDAAFVAVVRHPIAVSFETWRRGGPGFRALLRHWVAAQDTFDSDRVHVRRLLVVRFEHFLKDPTATLAEVHRFLGVEPGKPPAWPRPDANERHFRRWRGFDRSPLRRLGRALLEAEFERPARRHGYSLAELDYVAPPPGHPSAAVAAARER